MARIDYVGLPFQLKRRDSVPFDDDLQVETSPGSGLYQPLNCTGAALLFSLSDGAGVLKFSGAGAFRNAALGQVRFLPTTTQTDLPPGDYRAEWQVTFASGITQTIPAGNQYRQVIIGEDLD